MMTFYVSSFKISLIAISLSFSPWNRVLFYELIAAQLVKKLATFMTQGSSVFCF